MEPTRVNIQYSIDLEELPTEVERMLFKVTDCIEGAASEGRTLENHDDLLTISTLNKISDLRLCLSRADLILEDMVKIIGGYLKMNMDRDAQPQQPPATQQQHAASHGHQETAPPHMHSPPVPPMGQTQKPMGPDFLQLQEKLQKFADSLPDESTPKISPE